MMFVWTVRDVIGLVATLLVLGGVAWFYAYVGYLGLVRRWRAWRAKR